MARVLRIAEARRERHVGVRHFRDLAIANERQDRMVKRRRGYFDLLTGGELAVNRNYLADHLDLLASEHLLLVNSEIAAFADQAGNILVLLQKFFIEPCQLREYLQISKRLTIHQTPRPACISSGGK